MLIASKLDFIHIVIVLALTPLNHDILALFSQKQWLSINDSEASFLSFVEVVLSYIIMLGHEQCFGIFV